MFILSISAIYLCFYVSKLNFKAIDLDSAKRSEKVYIEIIFICLAILRIIGHTLLEDVAKIDIFRRSRSLDGLGK